jgi:hypothetical protein
MGALSAPALEPIIADFLIPPGDHVEMKNQVTALTFGTCQSHHCQLSATLFFFFFSREFLVIRQLLNPVYNGAEMANLRHHSEFPLMAMPSIVVT